MPRRKALLIGINYFGTKHQLNGCINDAMNLREYLVRDRGFSPAPQDMVVMTDAPENKGTPFEPTGANMIAVSCPQDQTGPAPNSSYRPFDGSFR
jgi:hypothetical protein